MQPELSTPLISIIVPFYNVEKYARKCIESLLSQTLTDIEIILVDDGSPDRCGDICDEYAASDSRIKVIHKKNEGVSAARNAGLDIASADIIGFVDSDDWVSPDMFHSLYTAMIRHDADIAVCNISYEYKHVSQPDRFPITHEVVFDRDEALKLLMDDKRLHNYACDKIFRKHIITEKFPVGCRFEDIMIMLRWVSNIRKMVAIPLVGYHYVQRGGSYMHRVSPERTVDSLTARLSQLHFLKANNLIPEMWSYYDRRIVEEAVRDAKYLTQQSDSDSPHLYDGLKHIVNLIIPFVASVRPALSGKKRRRLSNLMNRPRYFVFKMRLVQAFHRIGRRKAPAECFE